MLPSDYRKPFLPTRYRCATGDSVSEIEQLRAENARLRQMNHLYRSAITFAGHEWRSQLSLLNLSANRLQQDTLNSQQKTLLARLQRSAAAMLRIAHHYMSLSHIEYGLFQLHPVLTNPVENILKPVFLSFADLLADRRQTYFLSVSRPGVLVWADSELLLTACQNMIGTAIRYGEPGSHLAVHVLERGNMDEFSFTCNNKTVTEYELHQLTAAFGRHLNTALPTEIGLYIARLIIEAHQGSISFEAHPGGRMHFAFTLPKRGLRN